MFSFSPNHSVFFHEAAGAGAAPHGLLPDGSGSSFQLPQSYFDGSSSAHSLLLHHHVAELIYPTYSSSPTSSSSCDYLDFNGQPARRVLGTRDLQGMNCPDASHRMARYSAEERKERIERYRSKRNRRNFHKKIAYACRKTLADSRPRVKGRFTRKEEMEIEKAETATAIVVNLFSHDTGERKQRNSRNVEVDWRSQLQAALATEDEADSCYNEELIASFTDALSVNLYS
ncbi:zinc finger protein CO3-like [Zingiber officinale]|nr:zinc finger protein CO3-like [Zingiber officinale]